MWAFHDRLRQQRVLVTSNTYCLETFQSQWSEHLILHVRIIWHEICLTSVVLYCTGIGIGDYCAEFLFKMFDWTQIQLNAFYLF